ncbi:NAD+ synthase [Halobellus clavatus]|uniref:NH(3)-dependent NAD(+) synthetase n=1 Tax=Halobellus clavatus TaxID=660517 RepID=A0A1H3CTZ2_9EURY|nr:NAD+ synthase [Halobellus clavatus]SDX57641.1 NAD+ synthase [Halobellus clavatus]
MTDSSTASESRAADAESTDSLSTTDGSLDGEQAAVPSIVDPEVARQRIETVVRETVEDADARGVVVNMSGGLDSTVTAALAVDALGPERVYGLILPCTKLGATAARDAEALADALGIDHDTVHLQPLFARFGSVVPDSFGFHDEPVPAGNAIARFRMMLAYFAANATDRLVCGTTNRSERLLGYFTKHGDGAADLLPIGHLYKTEVRELAEALDVPDFVLDKEPTPGIRPGQVDADDLGAPYDVIDPILELGVDAGLEPDAVAARVGVDVTTVTDLLDRHEATAHKRRMPAVPTRDRDR